MTNLVKNTVFVGLVIIAGTAGYYMGLSKTEPEIRYSQEKIMEIIAKYEETEGQTLNSLYSEFCGQYPNGAHATTQYGSKRVYCGGEIVFVERARSGLF